MTNKKVSEEELSDEDIEESLKGLRLKGLIEATPFGYKVKPEVEAAFKHEGSDPKDRN